MTKSLKKNIRIRNKLKKIKKPTHSQVKNAVDDVFNTYIKYRDGWKCVQCGSEDKMTAGHVIAKNSGDSIRYVENNVFAQCSTCNNNHRYTPHKYHNWFIQKFGKSKWETLCEKAGEILKYSTQDLIELFYKYENKLKREYGIDFKKYANEKSYVKRHVVKAFPNYFN